MPKKSILKAHSKSFELTKRFIDLVLIAVAAYLAFICKFGTKIDIHWHYWLIFSVGLFFVFFCFNFFPLYRSWRGESILTECKLVFFAWVIPCLLLIVYSFVFKVSVIYSRLWLSYWFLIGLLLLLTYRICVRELFKHYRKLGLNQRSICLISHGNYGKNIYDTIINNPAFGFNVTGVFANNNGEDNFDGKLLGSIAKCYKWLHENSVDQLWIAVPIEKVSYVKRIMHETRHLTMDIRYLPDMNAFSLINHSFSEIAGMPLINLNVSPMEEINNRFIKRCEDIIIGSLILFFSSPLLLVISLIIKLTSKGPVFYKQIRVGLNNKPFTIFKFRSMPVNIEKNSGAVWAKAKENRATPFGAFMRKTSLDELPQFINVVRGDMSIVGPRPERPEFVKNFKEEIPSYMKKHMVKAGITGWAQICGWRGNTDLHKRIEHDIYYIENWSLMFDLKIIFFTVFKGFVNKNAY